MVKAATAVAASPVVTTPASSGGGSGGGGGIRIVLTSTGVLGTTSTGTVVIQNNQSEGTGITSGTGA